MTGRKLCISPYHEGPRWRLSIYFRPTKRLSDGSPRHLQSECERCERVRQRIAKRERKVKIPDDIRAELRRESERLRKQVQRRRNGVKRKVEHDHLTNYIDIIVDARRFLRWLRAYVEREHVIVSQLAVRTGVDERRVRTLVNGEYKKRGKTYKVKRVTLDVMARILEAAGEEELLVELAPKSAIREYRWKPGGPPEHLLNTGWRRVQRVRRGEPEYIVPKRGSNELVASPDGEIPDLIGQYLAQRRARRARDT